MGGFNERFGHQLAFLGTFALGDVTADADNAMHLTVGIRQRRLQGVEQHLAPIGVTDPFLNALAVPGFKHGAVFGSKRKRCVVVKKIKIGFANLFPFTASSKHLKRRIAAQVNTVDILEKDQVWHGIDQRPHQHMLFVKFCHRFFFCGDVNHDATQALRFTHRAAQHLDDVTHPGDAAVLFHEAVFKAVVLPEAGLRHAKTGRQVPVLRVQMGRPKVLGEPFFSRVTKHANGLG